MEKKEKREEQGLFGKSVLWTVVSYVVISAIAGVCSVVRSGIQGESGATVSGFVVFEAVLFPVLFFIAGYFGAKIFGFEKFKTYKVLLFSLGFSAALMLLWYVLLSVYVVFNLPVAEGSLAPDLFLRKITVVQDYTVLYLKETDGYKYVLLPLIHFCLRFVYWVLFALGNRKYVVAKKEKMRTVRK